MNDKYVAQVGNITVSIKYHVTLWAKEMAKDIDNCNFLAMNTWLQGINATKEEKLEIQKQIAKKCFGLK